MKTIKDILLLGDPQLYEVSEPVTKDELPFVKKWVADLHNVMEEVRSVHHFGRSIAAPQLGYKKRLVYMNIDKPVVIINPEYTFKSEEMFEVWDDCMCFPNLLVLVRRHLKINLKYIDENWEEQSMQLEGSLSELLQHEIDHLDGILCTQRAIDLKSFKIRRP